MLESATARLGKRVVKSRECDSSSDVSRGVDDLYDDRLDVLIVRNALPIAPLSYAAAILSNDDRHAEWVRPNAVSPPDDIHILGTDAPGTPTYSAPMGASLEAYLAGASKHRVHTTNVFPSGFDEIGEIERAFRRAANGRPVELARSRDGRPFTPYTLRRLDEGKQIGLHHDYHYRLALYKDLATLLDTTTLVSWVFTLQRPDAGGELVVYGLKSDDAHVPRGAQGRPDVERADENFDHQSFAMNAGDLFLLASGRCFHRVSPVTGAARLTMGGFLALDAARQRVLYWS